MSGLFKGIPTETKILVGALLALTVFAFIFSPNSAMPSLSVRNADIDGAMVLKLWLEELGYNVQQAVSDPIELDSLDVLFVLEPLQDYTSTDATRIREWVQRGNTLIVAGAPFSVRTLLDAFDVSLFSLGSSPEPAALSSPTLLTPPLSTVPMGAIFGIETERENLIAHLYSGVHPVLVSFSEGAGEVWVSGLVYPFTNHGIQTAGSAELVLNLVNGISRRATIGFDEAAHGFGALPPNVFVWLTQTAPGWGVVLAFVLTMLYLALRGRRFGPVLALPDDRLRREPVEYIRAIANLYRRSGQRIEIMKHYNSLLRRKLSERYALDPRVSDTELVKVVAYRDESVNPAELHDLLGRLSQTRISEQELVSAIHTMDNWLKKHL